MRDYNRRVWTIIELDKKTIGKISPIVQHVYEET